MNPPAFPDSIGACFSNGQFSTGFGVATSIMMLLMVFTLFVRDRATFAGRRFFIDANLGLIYWLGLSSLEQWTLTPECKVFFAGLTYPGIALAPVAFALFLYRYAYGVRGPMQIGHRVLLIGIPTLITTAAATNPWHGLFYLPGTGPLSDQPGAPIHYLHGPLFNATAVILYAALLASLALLSLGALTARSNYRVHFVMLFTLTLAPLAANLGYIVFGVTIFGIDPTPFLFIFAAFAYGVLILSNKLFDLVSIGRQTVFNEFPQAVLIVNVEGRVQSANSAAVELLDLPDEPDLDRAVPWLAAVMPLPDDLRRSVRRSEIEVDGRLIQADFRPVLSPLGWRQPTIGWIIFLEDVTDRRATEEHLTRALRRRSAQLDAAVAARQKAEALALRDQLTGLLNRRGLDRVIERLKTRSGPGLTYVTAVVDLDHFKQINDVYGHLIGDLVLVRVANTFRAVFRSDDRVFRFGGEEFLILSPRISLEDLASRLDEVRKRLVVDPELREKLPDRAVQFSAGLALWDPSAATVEQTILLADERLYEAKRQGRNRNILSLD